MYTPWGWSKGQNMWEHFKILDFYNITLHSLVYNKLSESIMHGATIKYRIDLVSWNARKYKFVYFTKMDDDTF